MLHLLAPEDTRVLYAVNLGASVSKKARTEQKGTSGDRTLDDAGR